MDKFTQLDQESMNHHLKSVMKIRLNLRLVSYGFAKESETFPFGKELFL